MEKNNDTQKFESKKNSKKDFAGVKSAGMGLAGAAVGSTATAFTTNKGEESEVGNPTPEPTPIQPEPKTEQVVPDTNPEPVAPSPEPNPIEPEPDPIVPEPEPIVPKPEPKPIDPEPEPEPKPIDPEPEPDDIPYVPAIEIDPNDNDVADIIQDVTSLDVIRDVNGNEMLVATAHNAEDGEFYLVDMDVDGDFDVILDGAGIPVKGLVDADDKLITLTDLDVKVSGEDYVAPNEIDESIAQDTTIGEDIQMDIIEV